MTISNIHTSVIEIPWSGWNSINKLALHKANENHKKQTKGNSLEYKHPVDERSELDHLHKGPTDQNKQNGFWNEAASFGQEYYLHGNLHEERRRNCRHSRES